MATIRDELIISDQFTQPLQRYVSGLTAAAQAARAAYSTISSMASAQAQASSQAASSVRQVQYGAAETASAVSNQLGTAVNMTRMYAAEIVGLDQRLAQLSTEMAVTSQRLTETASAQGASSQAAQALKNALSGLIDEAQSAADRQARLRGLLEETAGGARQAARAIDQYRDSASRADSASGGLNGTLKNLAATYLSLRTLKEAVNLSDTMTQTAARLDLMNDGLQTTEELQNMVYQSAQRARGVYTDMVDMVAKLGVLAGDAFSGNREIVAFSEQLNKMFTISGTDAQGQKMATLQLTQAMSMGVLRGQELRTVMQQVPMIVQSIADYLDVSTGKVKEMADEGQISAEIVKNAMFAAADETNAKFEEMPMTWGQVWNGMKNEAIMALQPLLNLASLVAQHWEALKPVFIGAAAAVGVFALVTLIATAVTKGFFAALLSNPIFWIAMAIGVVIGLIYRWVESVGGLKVAWLIVVDAVLSAWDKLKYGFFVGVYWVQDLLDRMGLAFQTIGVNIVNFVGDMKVGALTILQNMVNGAIDLINGFIEQLNKIPGVSIDAIAHTTFAATAAAEHEAATNTRNAELAAAREAVEGRVAERAEKLVNMQAEAAAAHLTRVEGIEAAKAAAAAEREGSDFSGIYNNTPDPTDLLGDIADNTGKTAKNTADAADEDLKMLEDVAVRRYETHINSTSLTPSITVNVKGNADKGTAQDIASAIADILARQAASHTSLSYAEV